jgi:hypothetical protein
MKFDLTGNLNVRLIESPSEEVPAWAIILLENVEEINRRLGRLETKERMIMTSVADIQAKANATLDQVKAETDVVNAVKLVVDHSNEMIATLKQQLADAIAAGADLVRHTRCHPGVEHVEY